jgi:hypothetical protein
MDLKQIERGAYSSYFENGLVDLTVGMIIIAAGIIPILESIGIHRYIGYILFLIIPLLHVWARIKFINPRIGLVKFRSARKRRIKVSTLLTLLVVMFTILLLVMTITVGIPSSWNIGQFGPMIWIGLGVIIIMGIKAYILDFPRLAYLGLIIGICVPLHEYLFRQMGEIEAAVLGFILPGLLMATMGAYYLVKFLSKYPKPTTDE